MSESRLLAVTAMGCGVARSCLRAWGLVAVGTLVPAFAWGQLPSSRLDHLLPAGGSPGASVEVTAGGADLDDASSIVFSHPGIVGTVKTNEAGAPVYGTFVVTIDGTVPEGIYEARVTGRFGRSNVRRFAVDRLTGVLDSGANRSIETAQSVSVGSVVDGRLEANEKDYYRVAVTAGQHLLIEALAPTLDSKATPTLEVLDAEGRELAKSRGVPGSSTRLRYTASVEGVVLIAVQDLLYQGSADHFYRLRIHTGPQIEQVSPGVIPANQVTQVLVTGRGITAAAQDAVEQVTVAVDPAAKIAGQAFPFPAAALDELNWAEARVQNPEGRSASLPLIVSELAIIAETESEDEWADAPTATPITLPCIVDGRFAEENDRDWFEFSAKAGERWWIEVFAHRIGMPVDAAVTVYQMTTAEDGSIKANQLAFVDDPGDRAAAIGSDFDLSTDDPAFAFQAPADGTFRIAVDDQFGGNRADASVRYALQLRPERPRARLVVTPSLGRPGNDQQAIPGTLEVRRGGTERLTVALQRLEGFAGPVTVSIEGLPAGVVCDPVVIAPFSGSGMLVVRAADDAAEAQVPIRIVGRYGDAAAPVETAALVGTLGFGTDNRAVRSTLPRLANEAQLSVVVAETEPVVVRFNETRIVGSRGARIELPVTIERRMGFEGQVVLNPVGQHGELKPAPLTFEPGVTQLNLVVDMTSGNLPAGTHQTVLQGDVTFKYVRRADLVAAAEAQQAQIVAEIAQLEASKVEATTFLGGYEAAAAALAQRVTEVTAQQQAAVAAATLASRNLVAATDAADTAASEAAIQEIEVAVANRRIALHSLAKLEAESQALAATKAQHEATLARVEPALVDAQARKAAVDPQVEQVRQANQPADRVYTAISPQIEVQVEASPIQLTVEGISVAVGGSGVLTLQVERRFGYAGPVTIAATTPDGSGVTIGGGEVPADQNRIELPVTVTPEAPAATVSGTLKATVNFNNLALESTASVPVTIVPGS